MTDFGFVVEKGEEGTWENGKYVGRRDSGKWTVYLPHSCDEWRIAGEFEGVPHDEAVTLLAQFITEASEALAALVEKREIKHD